MNIIQHLEARGFIDASSGPELEKLLETPQKIYCGFDPTSDGLHLGNYVPMMGLAWFQRFGHTPVCLVGGATALVGDPSGKSKERPLLDAKTIEANLNGIKKDLTKVLDFAPTGENSAIMCNNYDWFSKINSLEFLRDVGKFYRMGPMLGKEMVRSRLESAEGLSYTEFSYQILQGYDFYHLFQDKNVRVQLGGSDQWGNIVSGIEFTRKKLGQEVHGLTFPLLTRSDGKKFGKSEEGAIWLSSEKLSPYEFYQYLYRTPDADVIKMLKMLTFVDLSKINEIEKQMNEEGYVPNTAQKYLAVEVTRIVHGDEGVEISQKITESARPGKNAVLDVKTLENLAKDMPSIEISMENWVGGKLIDVMMGSQIVKSKGEARKLIRGGGVSLNNKKVADENYILPLEVLLDGKMCLLSIGKKRKILIRINSEK